MLFKHDPFDDPFFQDPEGYNRKQMKKMVFFAVLLTILTFATIFRVLLPAANQSRAYVRSFVGKTVLIQKDTLLVINYNTISRTYTLSDGKQYDIEFVKNNIIVTIYK